MAEIKLRSFRLGKRGTIQLQITIPRTWVDEHGLGENDFVDLLKDTEDRLIVVPGRKRK